MRHSGRRLTVRSRRGRGLASGEAGTILEEMNELVGWINRWRTGYQWRTGFAVLGFSEPGCSEKPLPASAVYTAERPQAMQCRVILP